MAARRREWLLLAAILILAAVLRIAWPTLTEFKFSEARLEALALEITREGRLPLVGVPSSAGFDHSPLSVYLYVPAFLLSANPIPATIYGGLIGLSAVVLCWWYARQWPGGGRWAALVSATLFAVSPWAVAFSRKIWQVVFVAPLALLFVGLVVAALIRGRPWRLAGALLVYAVLVQIHPSAISLAPALAVWLILFWRQVKIGPLLVGLALGLLTALPFLIHQYLAGWPALHALRALPAATWDLASLRLAWEAITGRGIHALAGDAYPLLKLVPKLGYVFNLLGWVTVGASLWLLWRLIPGWRAEDAARRQAAQVDLVLLSWLAVPVLVNLRHSLDLHLHFFALVVPAAYLLVGRAAEPLLSHAQPQTPGSRSTWARKTLRIAGMVALVLLAAGQVTALLLMGRFVSSHDTRGGFGTPLGQFLAVADRAVEAAREKNAELLVVGRGDSIVVDELAAIFDVLLRDRVAYRFVNGRTTSVFPPHPALALLAPDPGEAGAWYLSWPTQALESGYRLVSLDGSWPQEGLDPVSSPRTFQNGVELQNYTWLDRPEANGPFKFWLLWQVLWKSPQDTHFFVQVVDAQGSPQAQQDAVGYPFGYRQKGDRILSKFDITLKREMAPGPLWLRVGLYVYPEIVNVPLIDAAGNPIGETALLGPVGEGP